MLTDENEKLDLDSLDIVSLNNTEYAEENFFLMASDETKFWNLDDDAIPNGVQKVYGLYLIHEGERTYCCSLAASSRADFIRNVFVSDQGVRAAPESLTYESGGQITCYFTYMEHDLANPSRNGALMPVLNPKINLTGMSKDEYHDLIWEQACDEALEYAEGYFPSVVSDLYAPDGIEQ